MRAVAVVGRKRDVIGVATHAISDELGDDWGAPLFRELKFFENQHTGAFADDESIAILVERPRSALRFFVAGG